MARKRLKKKTNHTLLPKTLLFCSIAVFLGTLGYGIVASIQFDRNYSGHLKRAADANTLILAEQELEIAVTYLDDRRYNTKDGRSLGRIDDHTSILYSTPDEQISFHYKNVLACLLEIRAVIAKRDEATPLERSNVLMKLRETLLDDSGQYGHSVTYPSGLAVYPDNTLLAFLILTSLFVGMGAAVGWVWGLIKR